MQWIPRGKVGQVRLATLAFGLLLTALPAARIDDDAQNGGVTGLAITALVVLLLIMIATALLRRQISIWEGPATAVLVLLVGLGMDMPLGAVSICIGVIVAQSMYGSLFSELVRVAAFLPVLPLCVALSVSPMGPEVSWDSPVTLSLIPTLPLFAMLVRLLKGTLETQAEAKARARFKAQLTGDLLAADNPERTGRIIHEAAVELSRIMPGLVQIGIKASPGDPELAVQRAYGLTGDSLPAMLPGELITGMVWNQEDGLLELEGIGPRMAEYGLPNRRWYGHGDLHGPDATPVNLILFGIPSGLLERLTGLSGSRNAERLSMFRTLIESRQSAYDHLREQQELLAAANRDDVTGLLKRSGFLPRLDELLGGDDDVALVMIGFDGLSMLVIESGLAAAAMAVSRLARRLLDVVGDAGPSCRFSDNRFVVAVSTSRDDVSELAETLRLRLAEPVALAGRSVSLSISIGTARATPGTTGWELVERAGLALRLDQETALRPLLRTA